MPVERKKQKIVSTVCSLSNRRKGRFNFGHIFARLNHSASVLQYTANLLSVRIFVIVKCFLFNIFWPKFLVLQLVASLPDMLRAYMVAEVLFNKVA